MVYDLHWPGLGNLKLVSGNRQLRHHRHRPFYCDRQALAVAHASSPKQHTDTMIPRTSC